MQETWKFYKTSKNLAQRTILARIGKVLLNSQVCQYPIYAGAIKLIEDVLSGANIEVSWVDSGAPVGAYEEAIKPNTKVSFVPS